MASVSIVVGWPWVLLGLHCGNFGTVVIYTPHIVCNTVDELTATVVVTMRKFWLIFDESYVTTVYN